MSVSWPALLAVGFLAAVHLFAGSIFPVTGARRPHWLSVAGGITVAYVFVHILPELAEEQAGWLELRPDRPLEWLEHQIYVGALIGVLFAYGLDHVAHEHSPARFWARLGSFALYNVLIGYYATHIKDPTRLALAAFALGAHFLVNDRALKREGETLYRQSGRLLLASSVVLGALLGFTVKLPEPVLAAAFAVLAGGIILHALDEEIPAEREGRFGFFALGAVAYTALLLGVMELH